MSFWLSRGWYLVWNGALVAVVLGVGCRVGWKIVSLLQQILAVLKERQQPSGEEIALKLSNALAKGGASRTLLGRQIASIMKQEAR